MSAAERETSRVDVRSADGTSIAVWVAGEGPPLVLVHGSLCDHTRFDPLVAELGDGATTFAMDRRGLARAATPRATPSSGGFEDVAAVVDAVADRTGEPVALWGHSYGANCAMGGAARTDNVHHLLLYEPSLGLKYPPGSIEAVEQALAAGDREAAIRLVFVGIMEMSEEEVEEMRPSPLWPVRLASAPTVPRECRVEEGWAYRPGQFSGLTAPTLVLTGSETPPAVREATDRAAAAISNAEIQVLEGHGHFAFQAEPAMVAASLGSSSRPKRCSRGEEAKRRAHSSASGTQAPTPSPEGHLHLAWRLAAASEE